jgi:hypothetical protein
MQVHPGFTAAREASLKLMRKKQFKIMQLQGSCDNFYLPMRQREGKKLRENMARKAEIQKREKERGGWTKEREERGGKEWFRLSPPSYKRTRYGLVAPERLSFRGLQRDVVYLC